MSIGVKNAGGGEKSQGQYVWKKYSYATWANGTDEQIAAMVDMAHQGIIKLSDYWTIGETRSVQLSSGVNSADTTIAAQEVELVLVHQPSSSDYYGGGEFIIQQKDCLSVKDHMNGTDTNAGSFAASAMASFLNNNSTGYLSMIPDWLRSILLEAQVMSAKVYNKMEIETSTHKIFLPAEPEIHGGGSPYANAIEQNKLDQWTYYKTNSNRCKRVNGSNSYWWKRSPGGVNQYSFCVVNSNNYGSNICKASLSQGVAPCMLI